MNQLDLLLVCVGNTRKKVYQTLAGEFTGIEPPSWIIITAGFVRKHGFSVRVLDANVENLDHDETVERITAENPKLVGIVNYGQQANTAAPLMTETRNRVTYADASSWLTSSWDCRNRVDQSLGIAVEDRLDTCTVTLQCLTGTLDSPQRFIDVERVLRFDFR